MHDAFERQAREQVFIATVHRLAADAIGEHGVETLGDLPDPYAMMESLIAEAAERHGFSAEVGTEIFVNHLDQPGDDDDGVAEIAERVHETGEDALRTARELLERDNEDDDQ